MADGTCPVVDDGTECGRQLSTDGLCHKHYMRRWRTGTVVKAPRLLPLAERFNAKTVKDYNEWGCWYWDGETSPGDYGKLEIRQDGRRIGTRVAHAVSWEIFAGRPVPESLELDHFLYPDRCIGPRCVNPEHVRPTSRRINVLRGATGVGAINARKTHCPRGHPYDLVRSKRGRSGELIYSRDCSRCKKVRDARARERTRAKRLTGPS